MPGALEGVRILDMTIWQQGTSGSAMLADLGADVVKIEEPRVGDPGRGIRPIESLGGLSGYFEALNRGKRSLAIDMKHPKARELILRLARDADVFMTNYRPGVCERLGIGYDDLREVRPDIIFARASGYGREGPDAREGCYDILGQARGGLMSVSGDPDRPPGYIGAPIADQTGGILCAFGILAALVHRARTGEGQEVDVSLLGSTMALQSFNITTYLMSGEVPARLGRNGVGPFWNTYQGSDGKYFAIGMLLDRGWPETCQAIGRADLLEDERFTTFADRMRRHAKELKHEFDAAFAAKTADEWVRILNEVGVFCSRVQDYEELANDPQVIANSYIVDVPREDGPPLRMAATPIVMSKTPVHLRARAPELGQHTEEVLIEAGFTWDEIDALRTDGVIGLQVDRAQIPSQYR
jgi:crotonobetainyl-CoA:carnitine CoA-transferase CaiB-like acyl-CoA transferase